ncbi:hypothetical protein EJV47_11430 [Hymenobacter gummosus]|uniref:Uncharacterized protein n=1 Tax=Hymenobacter gummosus TaxID=1776032 RepID=A0A431U3R0_9BACT|nr:hypothetical protein [Hymenobacter gummosus]RTQ50232.1 hypothetical protein EJV47_11430 [Hymenobacter gummosus]
MNFLRYERSADHWRLAPASKAWLVLATALGAVAPAYGRSALEDLDGSFAVGVLLGWLLLLPLFGFGWPALLGWATCRVLRSRRPGYTCRAWPCAVLAIGADWAGRMLNFGFGWLGYASFLVLPVSGAVLGYYLVRRPAAGPA